jgi:fatty acid desaturase
MHKSARTPQWDLSMNRKKVALYALKDLVGYSIPDLIIILTFARPKKKSLLVPVAAMHITSVVACGMAGFWWVPVLWYVSMATSFMMFFRLRLWLEHQGTYDTQRIHLNWWQSHLLAPHNIWMHWEHHEWPTVPYHKLQQARNLVKNPVPMNLSALVRTLENSAPRVSGAALDVSNVANKIAA